MEHKDNEYKNLIFKDEAAGEYYEARSRRFFAMTAAAALCAAVLMTAVFFADMHGEANLDAKSLLKRPAAGEESQSVALVMDIEKDGEGLRGLVDVTLSPAENAADSFEASADSENAADELEALRDDILKKISADKDGDYVYLPNEQGGCAIRWFVPRSEPPLWIAAICVLMTVYLYFSRFDSIKRMFETRRADVESELASFLLEYILMLNAGLVCSAAADRLIGEHGGDDTPFYRYMRDVKGDAERENRSFASGLYAFASHFGSKNLKRIASLIYENSDRGVELSGKLQKERDAIRSEGMFAAKARAKQAETKLCLPLMLSLLSLVLISIAPAMIEI